ncbi:MAG: dihydrolipoyl dehydrogenase [Bacteroidota bacterium]
MSAKSFDLAVVGGGPGGYTAAIRAARLGMSTVLIEKDRLGGVCLNWGCIPSKALLKNAEILQTVRKAGEWGISCGEVTFDFGKFISRSRGVADRISKGVEYLMKKNKVEVIPGTAALAGGGMLEVTREGHPPAQIGARHIILATGARPRSIPGVTIDRRRVITSTEAMTLPVRPSSMVVVGAGAIGMEFAWFYNTLGTRVTVLEMMPGILPLEDRELTRLMESSFRKQGMEIITGARVQEVRSEGEGVRVTVAGPEGEKRVDADAALVAVGVQANVEGIGLERAGVEVKGGHIAVDADYRTTARGVHAVGDVVGPPWLAHVASAEGIHCVEAIAGLAPPPLDYSAIPGCTYCHPPIASVGLTEEKAREAGHEITVGRFPYRPLGKAMATGDTEGMVKLILDARYGEILGAHIMGAGATEMIHELVLARRLEATGRDIFRTVHAHPTLSEAVMEAAAAAYGEAINI